MRIVECKQLSPEWWEARRGIPTASEADKIITPKTGKLSASAEGFICQLLADRYCPQENGDAPQNAAMAHGTDCEPEARRYYEMTRNLDVVQVGLCLSDDGRSGCSPDGLVGEDGGLELKCPTAKTQIAYLLAGTLPDDYRGQVHMGLLVTGRKWWDFLSYSRGLPPLLIRVEPDAYTEKLAEALAGFLTKLDEAKAKLEGMNLA